MNTRVATTPTSRLYKVVDGFEAPAFKAGTNYLSDWPWRLDATNIPNRDFNWNGNPLKLNSQGCMPRGSTFQEGFWLRRPGQRLCGISARRGVRQLLLRLRDAGRMGARVVRHPLTGLSRRPTGLPNGFCYQCFASHQLRPQHQQGARESSSW